MECLRILSWWFSYLHFCQVIHSLRNAVREASFFSIGYSFGLLLLSILVFYVDVIRVFEVLFSVLPKVIQQASVFSKLNYYPQRTCGRNKRCEIGTWGLRLPLDRLRKKGSTQRLFFGLKGASITNLLSLFASIYSEPQPNDRMMASGSIEIEYHCLFAGMYTEMLSLYKHHIGIYYHYSGTLVYYLTTSVDGGVTWQSNSMLLGKRSQMKSKCG